MSTQHHELPPLVESMMPPPEMSLMVQSIPAMVYTYTINHADGTSCFPFVSQYCQKIFGFTAETLMAHPELLMNAVHQEDQQKFTKSVVDSMTNLTVWDYQFRMRHKDGHVKYVHGKSTPVNMETNGVSYTQWSGVLFDITAQEEHKQAAKEEMKGLVEGSMAPIFGIDKAGLVKQWNQVMAKLTGFTAEEAVGRPLVSFMAEDERNSMTVLLGSIMRSGDALSGHECALVAKDSQNLLHLYVKCTTTHDSNGECTGVAFVGQDITKVKEEEEKKEAALKLVDAEKGLTEWLSHEVRNPLSIATEAAEALKDDGFYTNPETASHIDLISQSLRYIVELLTDMLDLNKCIEGKITLRPKLCNIREEVLIPTRDMMNVRTKQVQVTVEGGEGLTAIVDSLRLRQVITNLVSNSLKFTSVGFVRVSLSKSREDGIGETMLISVSDSGCGISPAHYDSLFSKWEQLGSTTNGTGIGLCLVQSLVRVMGGHISLNRDYSSGIEGHSGAQFVIELPIQSILRNDSLGLSSPITTFDAVSQAVMAVKSGETSRIMDTLALNGIEENDLKESLIKDRSCVTGKYHILIVDDDRVGRKFIRRRFQRLFPDAIIEEAVSGEEAVIKAEDRDEAYDIITMDHFMGIGDMTGAEAIQALRSNKVDALIIGISGNAKQVEHLSAGAEKFWQKPMPSDETILEALIAHLSPPSGWSVLTVDDVNMNNHFMGRKLRKISSPHFTDMSVAEKRWNITAASTGEDAVEYLRSQSFDLVVLDHQLGDGMSGIDVGRFVREHSVNKDAIVVLNSGSVYRHPVGFDEGGPFNLFWPKPLPDASQMRLSLCCELLSRQRSEQD